MLSEVRATKPYDGKLKQRWFTDEDFDLTVWYEESGVLHGFQLCYDKRGADVETAVTWRPAAGVTLNAVDSAGRAATPILRHGGRTPDAALQAKFRLHAKVLEPQLKRIILFQLKSFARLNKLRPARGKPRA